MGRQVFLFFFIWYLVLTCFFFVFFFNILKYVVITGATDGIGRAYAEEVKFFFSKFSIDHIVLPTFLWACSWPQVV